jgi:hypothetical protein
VITETKQGYLKLTHANLSQPVWIAKNQLFSFYYSPSSDATHVLATGGAVLPVTESVDEMIRLLKQEENANE